MAVCLSRQHIVLNGFFVYIFLFYLRQLIFCGKKCLKLVGFKERFSTNVLIIYIGNERKGKENLSLHGYSQVSFINLFEIKDYLAFNFNQDQ